MMKETIKQWQIESIQEMSLEELVSIARLFSESGVSNLFVECVKYEIENRHRHQSRTSPVYHA